MTEAGFAADWPAPAGVKTWQTTRIGGVSSGLYSSLNLALHVGDEPQAVVANRALLSSAIGLPAEPCWLEQVHGRRILDLDQGETGPADGAVTSETGRVLVVMTADCMPLFLAAKNGRQIGVVHAGWRGLAGGVVEAAVGAFSCAPAEMLAWLGPAIGPDAFEVGDEVRDAFISSDRESVNSFARNAGGRWQGDLAGLARRVLAQSGIRDVFTQASCTSSDPERYFSYRREAPCGRMASLIWRES